MECFVCMDSEDPMEPMLTPRFERVIRTGCACRAESSLAHVGCLARAAEESKKDSTWWACRTCEKVFTGPMREKLATEFLARAETNGHARKYVAEMNVATAARLDGRFYEAEKMHRVLYERAVVERGAESGLAIKLLAELVADAAGLGFGASELGAQLLDVCERALGPKHASTIRARSDLAVMQCREAPYVRGAPYVRAAYGAREAQWAQWADLERTLRQAVDDAAEHDRGLVLRAQCNLCVVLRAMQRHTEACELESAVLVELTRVFGPDHPNTLKSRYEVACDLRNAGQINKAEFALRGLEADSARVFGPTSHKTRLVASMRAIVLRAGGIKKRRSS